MVPKGGPVRPRAGPGGALPRRGRGAGETAGADGRLGDAGRQVII